VRILVSAILGALLAWAPGVAATPPPVRAGAPVSAHAMVHTCCTPLPLKERIFAEAKAMGARLIRVDVELSGIFGAGAPQWARLDEVLALSRRYQLPVLGILMSPPGAPEAPPPGQFGRMAGEVAAHARGTIAHWEILNEPDGIWAFRGTPEDYAHMLRAAHDAIAASAPEAHVALGGLMGSHDPRWLERVFATPGADALHAFDIANVNLRGPARRLGRRLATWRALLARHGFTGPVWVTETGYPADPAFQTDPAFVGGEPAQAAFLTESVLNLAEAGASEVFVTLRDNLYGPFLSEGVLAIGDLPPYTARRKPAFTAVRRLVDRWATLVGVRSEQRLHEQASRLLTGHAAAASQKLRVTRALIGAATRRLDRLRALHRDARPHARAWLARRTARATARLRRRRTELAWNMAMTADFRRRAATHRQHARTLAAFVAGRLSQPRER
jgi:hypothetical protein